MKTILARLVLGGLSGVLFGFLMLPLLSLLLQTTPKALWAGLSNPLVIDALRLSALTTSLSLLVSLLFGTPLAWLLADSQRRSARLVETLLQLPIVIPPAVAGIALLLAFGRRSPFHAILPLGGSLAFSTAAVVLAEVFVAAPYYVQGALSAFRGVDRGTLLVARSLGAGPLRVLLRVAFPMALPGLLTAAATSWARALGEFGATLMFAGNLEGRTQTLPLAIYSALESDFDAALALAVIMVVLASALLLATRGASHLNRSLPRGRT